MLAYPGYTIEKIEVEMSWRRVGAMMELWSKDGAEPQFQRLQRIADILKKAHGLRYVSDPSHAKAEVLGEVSDEGLISSFQDLGMQG